MNLKEKMVTISEQMLYFSEEVGTTQKANGNRMTEKVQYLKFKT